LSTLSLHDALPISDVASAGVPVARLSNGSCPRHSSPPTSVSSPRSPPPALRLREIRIAPRAPWQNPCREAGDRLNPPRVPGSCPRPERGLISAGSYATTSPTITSRGHTNRSTTTVPSHE